ncbi:MAG: Ig-like domain-containing protein, partial [Solobacterium sp.]|nr:Ig-like domain-containing protein [Solobacterium sp.]
MSDSEYGTGSGAVKGKGLILEINEENKLTFTYYNEGATDVTEGGSFTEKDPVPIQEATIDEATEMGPDGQFTVVQPTIEVRNTLQLHYTTVPEDATVRSITWTSGDTSIATVDSTGKVKGVNPGTTTITATISDGITRSVVYARIDVEIVPRTSSDPMYLLTDTILPDKNYIIANKDTGEAYALLNNNGTVSTVTVEIDGDTVYTDNENIIFTTEGSGTTVTAVKNNGRYISAGNSSLTLVTSAPANRTFEYSADNRFTCRSGNSTYYIYYTTYNNRYTASTSASGSSSRAVYLFEEVGEQVAVTGVSVTPKTATVEARKTVDLTAAVSPANASNKTVTWRSSDTSVATVDANGRVRGVSEGTAVITASAGGFSDTCTVTVTQSTTTEQHYVIVCDGFALSTERSTEQAQGGSSSYTYTGLSGVEYAAGDAAADNIRWIFEEADGGYYIRSLDGDYLNATYTSGNNMGQGDLKVDGTPDVWVLDSGYSLDSGTVESSHLKSTNASSSATSDKYLGYEESPANLFTVRSSGNDDEVTISEAEDPVAVTGVSVTPKTAEIEARNTVQLTATVTPSNATNKTVTWSSSNTSVAVVDGNGRVRGVSEGEAVITASVGGFSDSCTVTVTASTSSEPTYVITVGNVALSTVPSDEQMENAGSGSQRYYYTGLAGAPFDPDEAADDTIRWILEPAEGGYYIKSLSGDYLNATYTQNSTGGYTGVLKLDSTPDVWVLDGTLDSWEVDGSLLKSSNASANASSPKYLAYDTGTTSSPRNLFTVRSESSASETTLVEAEDPVAVTGVNVTPETATVKARETVQLKATVTPSDATVKTVTWTSSNTAVATVDENGKVKGVAEGEAVITASAGGFSDTCTVTVTAGDPIIGYVIMIDGFALSTDRSPNQAQGGSSSYTYTGLAGVAYSAEEDPAENIRWILEETDGGYYIRSLEGRYLNGAYTSGSNSGQGNLKLDDTRDVWVLDGTLEDWMIDGSMIRSTNATASTPDRPKYLGYEEAPANLFTVRSEENADESTLVDPSVTIEERFVETDRFEDGKEYIIGVTKDSGSVYAIKNVTGTSTGNTGSITLDVTPASGSEAAYIVTDDKDVVWKYSGSNQYLIASTGSDHYLGYESSSYVPRTSSQGRAIIYSGGKLQISSGYYLTCTDGTFATTTNSGSGSDVRLFVKTIEIITHEHTYGDPVWSWSGNVTTKATRAAVSATATFTCTECGESITEEAAITTSEVSGRTLYTATVTGPDGKEYTDKKFAGDEAKYTITITADKETAAPGEEINFTITLGPVDRFGTFQMELAVPEGLTYKENSFEIEGGREGLINTLGFDDVDWTDSVRRFIGYTVGTDYISTEDTVLATFKCTVNSGFEGSATVGLTRLEFYSSEDWELNLTDLYEIITATINTHVHVAGETVVENEVQATCTADGGYDNVVYCTICEEEMSRTHVTVPATGHD